jgi:hypothetical protein
MPLRQQVRITAWLVPQRHWYKAAIFASRLHAGMTALLGNNRALTEAVMLDNWLRELTFLGPYPIPWRGVETEVLNRGDPEKGVLYCWTHLPLSNLPLRAYIDMGHVAPLVVADPGQIVGDNEVLVPGLAKRYKAIAVGPNVLMSIRTVLREGGSVACLADAEMGAPISSNIFRIAGMVGVRVIFQWAELQLNGTVAICFVEAPRPYCKTEVDIEANMEFLRKENRRILDGLGFRPQDYEAGLKGNASNRRVRATRKGIDSS